MEVRDRVLQRDRTDASHHEFSDSLHRLRRHYFCFPYVRSHSVSAVVAAREVFVVFASHEHVRAHDPRALRVNRSEMHTRAADGDGKVCVAMGQWEMGVLEVRWADEYQHVSGWL